MSASLGAARRAPALNPRTLALLHGAIAPTLLRWPGRTCW